MADGVTSHPVSCQAESESGESRCRRETVIDHISRLTRLESESQRVRVRDVVVLCSMHMGDFSYERRGLEQGGGAAVQ